MTQDSNQCESQLKRRREKLRFDISAHIDASIERILSIIEDRDEQTSKYRAAKVKELEALVKEEDEIIRELLDCAEVMEDLNISAGKELSVVVETRMKSLEKME